MWGGFLSHECDCADSLDLLHSSQQIEESLEVPERDLWLRHTRCDACCWPLLADPRCLRLPGFVHLWGLHGTNMECLRETRPCPCFPIPGLPIPAGDLAFISFCGDFDFSRHKFPMKGQCLGSGFLLICSSCPWADILQDSWWFGVPLLTRGPLIALPIVLATDYPAVQTVWVTFILLSFLACQALAWPWKALSSISPELGLKPFKIGCLWLGLPRYIYIYTNTHNVSKLFGITLLSLVGPLLPLNPTDCGNVLLRDAVLVTAAVQLPNDAGYNVWPRWA